MFSQLKKVSEFCISSGNFGGHSRILVTSFTIWMSMSIETYNLNVPWGFSDLLTVSQSKLLQFVSICRLITSRGGLQSTSFSCQVVIYYFNFVYLLLAIQYYRIIMEILRCNQYTCLRYLLLFRNTCYIFHIMVLLIQTRLLSSDRDQDSKYKKARLFIQVARYNNRV